MWGIAQTERKKQNAVHGGVAEIKFVFSCFCWTFLSLLCGAAASSSFLSCASYNAGRCGIYGESPLFTVSLDYSSTTDIFHHRSVAGTSPCVSTGPLSHPLLVEIFCRFRTSISPVLERAFYGPSHSAHSTTHGDAHIIWRHVARRCLNNRQQQQPQPA